MGAPQGRDDQDNPASQVPWPGSSIWALRARRRICEVRGPEHHIPRVPGVSLKYDWEKFGSAFMDALKEAERVLLSRGG